MGHDVRKSVFGFYDQVISKLPAKVLQTSWKIECLLVASLDVILSDKQIKKALIRMPRARWSASILLTKPKDRFSNAECHIYQSKCIIILL